MPSAYYHLYRLQPEQVGKCRIKDAVGWFFVSFAKAGIKAETYHLWTGRISAPVGLEIRQGINGLFMDTF
ncbi:MAG: hypothetical protein VR68_16275 [Peptococcaceae bacterium BRH_c4a]|nr:MAG: hypothetical protein VR68_16275 [Peptococcaceae bacterium BRH_c4a]